MLSRAKWVFRAPFCALALSPSASQKLRGKLGLLLGGKEAHPSPIPAQEWGPAGVGTPTDCRWHLCLARFSGMKPLSVWTSMTSGLQGKVCSHQCLGLVFRCIRPPRWVWISCVSGVSSLAGLCLPLTFPRPNPALLFRCHGTNFEALDINTELSTLSMNSTGDAVFPVCLG